MSDPEASTPAGEQRFGDYVLLQKIAQGGMAELFLAKRRGVEGFEKVVAIKRILPELSWNRDFVSMFINEAKIAARLSHPNVAQIFDFGKIDDYYFIAMEYVHGENLRTIQKRAEEKGMAFPPHLAAFVVARTCAGLDHAHRKSDESGKPLRIIHRDVSPQNVLVSFDGEVKVVDFGIAKAVAENPEATRGVLKGKLGYLSPEQVAGKNLDSRSDIFASGLLLYELCAGRKLFQGSDPAEILDAILHVDADEVARALPRLGKSLREVLRRSLQADPASRYAAAGEMQAALDAYLRESGEDASTMHLQNFMRLLFDEKMGERTMNMLRSQFFEETSRHSVGPSLWSPRLAAGLAGAVVGLVALAFAAPALRGSAREHAAAPPTAPTVPAANATGARKEEAPRATAPAPAAEAAKKTDPGAEAIVRADRALSAGRGEEAVAAYEQAFAVSPSLRDAHRREYARALAADGKARFEAGSDRAAERFQSALALDPDLFDAHFLLGKLYTRQADGDAAMREYAEAIRIDPKAPDPQFNLGFIHFSRKDYEKAIAQYEKVVALRPPYLADVFYNIAACYERLKRKPEAVATLRRGLEAVPTSDLLRQRLKQLGG